MAPKQIMAKAYKVVKNEVIQLHDISVESDSSWREPDAEEVERLYQLIKAGEYGNTTLKGPSLRSENKKVLPSNVDGKAKLSNGKRIVMALQRAAEDYEKMSEVACPALSQGLTKATTNPPK